MNTNCYHTRCHPEPPKVIHDHRCQLRRDQRDELKRKALYAYGLYFCPHTPQCEKDKAMRELLAATEWDG